MNSNYQLWLHPESDCYFWLPEGEDPGDPLCEDVTRLVGHVNEAYRQHIFPPTGNEGKTNG